MKRFVAIALAVVMIFAMAVAASADLSPGGKEYYKVTSTAEYDGRPTGDTTSYKVEKNSDETVTLTANSREGFFTRWIISGSYTIVDGSLDGSVITILPTSDVKAVAHFRKEEAYLNTVTEAVTTGKDYATTDKAKVPVGSDEVVTLTAVEVDTEFVNWELLCDYTIVEGSLKTKVLKIIPYTDIRAIAYFKGASKPGGNNESNTSPKTGDPLYAVIPFMAIALAAAFIAMKKLKAN